MCIPPRQDSEPAPSGEISEAILAALWNEQAHLRGPMWDCQGNPVSVVYRGRWTGGSGPDFEGAILSLGSGNGNSGLVTGCVEMHLRCADWWAHGHHADPRYNSVALHVVLWPVGARAVTRADGAEVPTLVLADYITLPAADLLQQVRPLLPNLGTLSEEPCWRRTQGWPLETLLNIIDAAGDERLLSRAAVMEADLHLFRLPDELFYRGIMDALGYSANREPMRALATALPLDSLLTLPLARSHIARAALLEAVFLGAAGFLPSQRPNLGPLDWLSSQYAEEVEALWYAHAASLGLPADRAAATGWSTERVRPANSPPRRLAAVARLLSTLPWEPGGMLNPFLEAAEAVEAASPEELAKQWTRLLTVPGDGYWAGHSDFGSPLQGERDDLALVGSSRAGDIAINVLLPLLVAYADHKAVPELRDKAMQVYARYPRLADNRITRGMADEALGPRKARAINGARRQQGLIHLYRRYCEARRYDCPLSGLRSSTRQGSSL